MMCGAILLAGTSSRRLLSTPPSSSTALQHCTALHRTVHYTALHTTHCRARLSPTVAHCRGWPWALESRAVHSVQCAGHSVQRVVCSAQRNIVHRTVSSVQCACYSVHCSAGELLHGIRGGQSPADRRPVFTANAAHCTIYTAHFTLHTAHYILHIIHCTLHTKHCTLLALNAAHCTLHSEHCTPKTEPRCCCPCQLQRPVHDIPARPGPGPTATSCSLLPSPFSTPTVWAVWDRDPKNVPTSGNLVLAGPPSGPIGHCTAVQSFS